MSESMARLVEMLSDALLRTQTRLLALQALLVEKGIVTGDELASRMQAMDDEATLEVEIAPEYEEFRQLRRQIRDAADSQGNPQEDTPR